MASEGPNNPGTMAINTSIGTATWGAMGEVIDNAKISDDTYAGSDTLGFSGNLIENSIKLVKGGTIQGDDKSTGAILPDFNADEYISYGGSTVLWGLSWSDTDINASNFGGVFSVVRVGGETSNYLKATNFGFSIPSGATINGILLEVEQQGDGLRRRAQVDHMRITVYYTEAVGFTRKIKIAGTFQDKPIKTKVSGSFQDKVIKIKVGGTFQDA